MSAQGRALDRSQAGTGVSPIFNPTSRDVLNGWRRETPPINDDPDETYEEVLAKQVGRRTHDNESDS